MTKLEIEDNLAKVQGQVTLAIRQLLPGNDQLVLESLEAASQMLLDFRIKQFADRRGLLTEASYKAVYAALMSSRTDATTELAITTLEHRKEEAGRALTKADAGLRALEEMAWL